MTGPALGAAAATCAWLCCAVRHRYALGPEGVRLLSTPSATLLLHADAALLAAEDAAMRLPSLALSAAPAAPRPAPSADSGLASELIGLRRRIAAELDVPPYTVFGEELVLLCFPAQPIPAQPAQRSWRAHGV